MRKACVIFIVLVALLFGCDPSGGIPQYTVTLDPNNGNPVLKYEVGEGETFTFPSIDGDLAFLGWSYSSDSSYVFYVPGDQQTIYSDEYLYAVWTEEDFEIIIPESITKGEFSIDEVIESVNMPSHMYNLVDYFDFVSSDESVAFISKVEESGYVEDVILSVVGDLGDTFELTATLKSDPTYKFIQTVRVRNPKIDVFVSGGYGIIKEISIEDFELNSEVSFEELATAIEKETRLIEGNENYHVETMYNRSASCDFLYESVFTLNSDVSFNADLRLDVSSIEFKYTDPETGEISYPDEIDLPVKIGKSIYLDGREPLSVEVIYPDSEDGGSILDFGLYIPDSDAPFEVLEYSNFGIYDHFVVNRAGTGELTAYACTDTKKKDSIRINFKSVPESIYIENDLDLLIGNIGDTRQLNITFYPEDTEYTGVSYASSDESILSIDENGLMTINGSGYVTVYVTSEYDDSIKNQKLIDVRVIADSIELGADSIELGNTDDLELTYQLNPVIEPEGAYNKIYYYSSNTDVATVDDNGFITAVGSGNATIYASVRQNEHVSDSIEVSVSIKPVDINMDFESILLNLDGSVQLSDYISVLPENAYDLEIKGYKSNDETVATVDSTGKVVAVGYGNTTVTISAADGVERDFSIIVPTAEQLGGVLVYDRYFDDPDLLYPTYSVNGDSIVATPVHSTSAESGDGTPYWRYIILNRDDNIRGGIWYSGEKTYYPAPLLMLNTFDYVGAGEKNTHKGIEKDNNIGTIWYAADSYNKGEAGNNTGFSDWYIPSKDELLKILDSDYLPEDYNLHDCWTSSEVDRRSDNVYCYNSRTGKIEEDYHKNADGIMLIRSI